MNEGHSSVDIIGAKMLSKNAKQTPTMPKMLSRHPQTVD